MAGSQQVRKKSQLLTNLRGTGFSSSSSFHGHAVHREPTSVIRARSNAILQSRTYQTSTEFKSIAPDRLVTLIRSFYTRVDAYYHHQNVSSDSPSYSMKHVEKILTDSKLTMRQRRPSTPEAILHQAVGDPDFHALRNSPCQIIETFW